MMNAPTTYIPPAKDDSADETPSDSVMLALLPITTDWCKLDLPHMTLVYAGKKSDHKPGDFNELAKDASMIAALSRSITLRVTGVKTMGPDQEKVDALGLQPTTELLAMRRAVESWNVSKFPFNPHATIGPVGSAMVIDTYSLPRSLVFDRIYVGWGEECLTFSFSGTRY